MEDYFDPFSEFSESYSDLQYDQSTDQYSCAGSPIEVSDDVKQRVSQLVDDGLDPVQSLRSILESMMPPPPETRDDLISENPDSEIHEDFEFWRDALLWKQYAKNHQQRPLRSLEGWVVIPANLASGLRTDSRRKPLPMIWLPESALSQFSHYFN